MRFVLLPVKVNVSLKTVIYRAAVRPMQFQTFLFVKTDLNLLICKLIYLRLLTLDIN